MSFGCGLLTLVYTWPSNVTCHNVALRSIASCAKFSQSIEIHVDQSPRWTFHLYRQARPRPIDVLSRRNDSRSFVDVQ